MGSGCADFVALHGLEKCAKNGFSPYFREIIAVKKLTKGIVSLSLEPQHHTSGDEYIDEKK